MIQPTQRSRARTASTTFTRRRTERRSVLLTLVTCAIGLASFGHGQGLFGAVAEAFVDTVNASVVVELDATARRLQVDAVAVAVRDSNEDCERFLASTLRAAEDVAGGPSAQHALDQTRAAASTLGLNGPSSSVWNTPAFTALQVPGLGTAPASVVEHTFDTSPGMRDRRVDSIACGAFDTPGVDRTIALLSIQRAEAPSAVAGSPYAGLGHSHWSIWTEAAVRGFS